MPKANGDSESCAVDWGCKNSYDNQVETRVKCSSCRLSPDNIGRNLSQYWSPTKLAKDLKLEKHPLLLEEKRQAKVKRSKDKLTKKRSIDKAKSKVLSKAAQAERTTEKNIIKATKNSGRTNKDGDHVSMGMITLDTKLQSTRADPVVNLHELDKVRADAKRAGKLIGGLVIRNRFGVGVVVLAESDYAVLVKGLNEQSS